MSGISRRWATPEDIVRYFGAEPGHVFLTAFPRWVVRVGERHGAILGLGGAVWRHDGECWAFCDAISRRPAHAKHIHVGAREALAVASETSDTIWARRLDIPGSERWLARLGFTLAYQDDEGEVWKWHRLSPS